MSACKACMAAIIWIKTPAGKSIPCDATPRYYIEKPRVGSKKIVTWNGQVLSCEYTEDPAKATWAMCRIGQPAPMPIDSKQEDANERNGIYQRP